MNFSQLFQSMLERCGITAVVLMIASGIASAAPTDTKIARIQMIAAAYNSPEREMILSDENGNALIDKAVELPINNCTAPMEVTSRKLVFTFGKDPTTAPTPGSVKLSLPDSGRDFILVFVPNAPNQGPAYRVTAVELPADKFKGGSYAFLNFSNTEIGCVFGKEKVLVAPGKAGVVSPAERNGMVFTACYEKSEAGWQERPFFSSRVPIQPTVRSLVLMSRDAATGRLGFRSVADFVN